MSIGKVLLATAMVATLATTAHADIYSNVYHVTVTEGLTNGNGFNAGPGAIAATANASFTYSGPLSFTNTAPQNTTVNGDLNSAFGFSTSNVSAYSGSGAVTYNGQPAADFSSLDSFLASSGSIAGYGYGSLYAVTLGDLAVGTQLTITHDDGVSLSPNASGTLTAGPTNVTTERVTVTTAGPTTLYYTRQNGTPSILQVAVPEPVSMSLLGAGLVGMGLLRRRSRKS